jgi:hypothetical protein
VIGMALPGTDSGRRNIEDATRPRRFSSRSPGAVSGEDQRAERPGERGKSRSNGNALGCRLAWLGVVVLLTVPAWWPLFHPGFFVSDDGRFHVYRIAALARAWQHGVFYPRLFPEFGFGYGQAVLNFYAPLSYWPGALLALLGLGPVAAAKITVGLAFLLAGLAAYGFARYLWGPAGGVLAAIAYTYFPYHLADAYLRGAIPEHFAFIWPPLILWAFTAAFREEDPQPPLLWGTLAWAALVYSHNLTAMLMIPVAGLYLVIMAWWSRRWRRLLPALGSLLLAVLLSAPLWLPFLAESGAVGIGLGPSDGYRGHLAPLGRFVFPSLFYRYRPLQDGTLDHPLSWLTLLLTLLVSALTLWQLARRRPLPAGPVIGFSLLLTFGAAFMVTSASLLVWLPLAPALAQLQYPWRFLTLVAVGVMGLAGALPALLQATLSSDPSAPHVEDATRLRGPSSRSPGAVPQGGEDQRAERPLYQSTSLLVYVYYQRGVPRAAVWALLAALALALLLQPLPYIPVQPLPLSDAEAWAPDRMWREDAETGQVGATWTGEFMPLTVREQRWALSRPREGAQDGVVPAPLPRVRLDRLGYERLEVMVEAAAAMSIRLHQFHLPSWRAWLDGQPVPTYASDELGLVTADVPPGAHRLTFQFGPSSAWIAGGIMALLGALAWALLAFRAPASGPGHLGLRFASVVLVVLALALALNRLGLGQQARAPVPVEATLGDVSLLVGWEAAPAAGEDALDVTLYWFALRDIGTNYKAFIHLVDGGGQVVAQHDGDPVGGFTPTTRWRSGEIIADRHRLALPSGMPAGEYTLKAGLYQFPPLRNLAVTPPTADGRVELGQVQIPLRERLPR